jgi:hypothetical protein
MNPAQGHSKHSNHFNIFCASVIKQGRVEVSSAVTKSYPVVKVKIWFVCFYFCRRYFGLYAFISVEACETRGVFCGRF